MNTAPTVLSPWFVVMRESKWTDGDTRQLQYYASEYERGNNDQDLDQKVWSPEPKKAMIFSSLTSAVRIAKALVDEEAIPWVRVLHDRDSYAIFRDQFSEPWIGYLNEQPSND